MACREYIYILYLYPFILTLITSYIYICMFINIYIHIYIYETVSYIYINLLAHLVSAGPGASCTAWRHALRQPSSPWPRKLSAFWRWKPCLRGWEMPWKCHGNVMEMMKIIGFVYINFGWHELFFGDFHHGSWSFISRKVDLRRKILGFHEPKSRFEPAKNRKSPARNWNQLAKK